MDDGCLDLIMLYRYIALQWLINAAGAIIRDFKLHTLPGDEDASLLLGYKWKVRKEVCMTACYCKEVCVG